MAKINSTKPGKPYPDFPLFAHASGRWAKKIRGRFVYFGPWSDPDTALQRYLDQKDALHSGRRPSEDRTELTMLDLCSRFLTHKKHAREARELSLRTFQEYTKTTKRILRAFTRHRLVCELRPSDFEQLRNGWVKKGWGPVTIAGEIQRVRSVFKYAIDAELSDKAIRFGPGFKKPSKKTLRLNRAAKGRQMFEAAEIQKLLKAAGPQMKAMILLGANCGFGNADCGKLPLDALDLTGGWINFPRPKTGIQRRCCLWPETVKAIKTALAKRPHPKDPADAGLLFITKHGDAWAKENIDNPVAKEFKKLLIKTKLNGSRGFYCLRRGFETIGGEARDQVAVDAVMGHAREDMASVYRQGVSDERLRAVTEHVRGWLFAKAKPKAKGQSRKPVDARPKQEAPHLRLYTA
jgi:integrase